MRVVVVGLGYVGSVCSACLASRGHSVVGVDVSESKTAAIEAGRSPIVEAGLDEMIAEAYRINHDEAGIIPLHQQSLAWGVSKKVQIVQRADNQILFYWVKMK